MNLESVDTRAVFCEVRCGQADGERRGRGRFGLRWRLSILRGHEPARMLSTMTENLNSGGFCCILEEPLAAGECVVCDVACNLVCKMKSQTLRCQAQVVWTAAMEDGRFRMGCRIDDYKVI